MSLSKLRIQWASKIQTSRLLGQTPLLRSQRKGPETICSARVIVVRIAATLVLVYWMLRGTIQYWPSSVGIIAQGRGPVDEHSMFALSKPIMPFGYSQELPECNRIAQAVRAVRWDSHAGMAAAIVCYRPAVNLWTVSYEPHGGVASHPRQPHKRMRWISATRSSHQRQAAN